MMPTLLHKFLHNVQIGPTYYFNKYFHDELSAFNSPFFKYFHVCFSQSFECL